MKKIAKKQTNKQTKKNIKHLLLFRFINYSCCLFTVRNYFPHFSRLYIFLVCVTEQHYVSIFFTGFWSVHKPRLFHTEKFQDSQQRMRMNTKPNGGKNEVRTEKNDIFVD